MRYFSNLIINIKELQIRTIYSFITFLVAFSVAFLKKVELFFVISKFFLSEESGFIYTNLIDPLIIYIKISFLFSIIFTFPIIFYTYAFFFFKAIYNFYIFYIFMYIFSFYFGGFCILSLCYFKIFPIILKFLLEFQRTELYTPLKLILRATMDKYFIFFYNFVCIFFFIFLFCNIFLIFLFFNMFNKQTFKKIFYRKFLYLLIIIFSLIFAPPDILLQLIILPFLIFLIEIIIYFIIF